MNPEYKSWRPCSRHPDTDIAPYFRICIRCEAERDHAFYEAERERRISEAVEIARRIIPLVVDAIRAYDDETRQK